MITPIAKREKGHRDLQELFQNYDEEYSREEWDTGAPVGLEKAPD